VYVHWGIWFCCGEKIRYVYIGSSFMSYAVVMNFVKKIASFMSLLASIVFNDSFGVPERPLLSLILK